ncbi:superinfection immunity protein [Bradyrhizobium sp. AUGA SZCCT0283]|uniref:superinfection immunity protein n=1 Tax=Bradyrhizobium sp. AUGA SZCCT0283 TaxID=2807671 RepID=UPI00289A88ED|nr:superinfection immunity protein [Bradyrhizobium sp. AUGA SZCCT0283]
MAVYFIPALNAAARKHHNQNAIFLLNLFLGWTFLGWVAALIWSATAIPQEYQQLAQQTQQPSRTTIRRRGIREPNALDRWFGEKAPWEEDGESKQENKHAKS